MTGPAALDAILERVATWPDRPFLVKDGRTATFGDLDAAVRGWDDRFDATGVPRGAVVVVAGDFDVEAIACLLAGAARELVLVPLANPDEDHLARFRRLSGAAWEVHPANGAIVDLEAPSVHPLVEVLRDRGHPGLVLFSSGSTGEPKAALHDLDPLLEKFRVPRRAWRVIPFLLFDHIGGVNTLLATISSGGCLVVATDRSPGAIAALVERERVELLPTSPTFLNLLLAARAIDGADLSSLQLVTYGTEPMPAVTLARVREALPHVELKQTYGLSEVGILRTKSRSSDSLWMRAGGEGYDLRVVDGLLEIKAASAMLGYLNAPSPFTEDGWFRTGDAVEVEGDWIRVLGRTTDVINVGGLKVDPIAVEGVVAGVDGVLQAVVAGEPHPLVGQMVVATVRRRADQEPGELRRRIRRACLATLDKHEVPQKIVVVDDELHNARFKRARAAPGPS